MKVNGHTVNFIKKETPAIVFSCKFCKIFLNTISKNIWERLLLQLISSESSDSETAMI